MSPIEFTFNYATCFKDQNGTKLSLNPLNYGSNDIGTIIIQYSNNQFIGGEYILKYIKSCLCIGFYKQPLSHIFPFENGLILKQVDNVEKTRTLFYDIEAQNRTVINNHF